MRAYDAVYDHILMMSDALADGIVKQFPDKFRASVRPDDLEHLVDERDRQADDVQ